MVYVGIVLEFEGGYLSVLNRVEQNNQSWLVIKVKDHHIDKHYRVSEGSASGVEHSFVNSRNSLQGF